MNKLAISAAFLLALVSSAGASLVLLDDAVLLNITLFCVQNSFDVVALMGGGFVAVWTGNLDNTAGLGGRLFGPDGQPVSGELHLDGGTAPFAGEVAVAPGAGGGFILAWWEFQFTLPPLQNRFALRTYDAGGQPLGAAVNVETAGVSPGIGLATDGAGRPAVA